MHSYTLIIPLGHIISVQTDILEDIRYSDLDFRTDSVNPDHIGVKYYFLLNCIINDKAMTLLSYP